MASVAKRKWTYNGAEKQAWVVRYTDHRGKERLKTFKLKKDADQYRTFVEIGLQKRTFVPESQSLTVAKAAELYVESERGRWKERKITRVYFDMVRYGVEGRIVPVLGQIRLVDLSFNDVDQWVTGLVNAGHKPKTVKHRLGIFRRFIEFCIRREWLAVNNVSKVIKERRSPVRTKIRTFTQKDIEALLGALLHRGPRFQQSSVEMMAIFVNVAAFCGLRQGEIAALTLPLIDLERRIIQVRASYGSFGEMKGPKTPAGNRDVPMPQHVAEMLRVWLSRWYVPNDKQLVFIGPRGAEFHRSNFHRLWKATLKRAGLNPDPEHGNYHFHALRHFYVSMLVQHRVPITDIAALAGHRSFDVTLQVYAHEMLHGVKHHDIIEEMSRQLARTPVLLPAR